MHDENKRKADFFKSMQNNFSKCLDPTMSCKEDAIKAHSVQNANALSLIEKENHVYEIKQEIIDNSPVCKFKKIGRRKASTFTGLCNEHDSSIFHPIDTEPLSPENLQHMFLVAYRSVTRELHVTMEAAYRLQTMYMNMIERGDVAKDEVCPPAIIATQHLMKAWGVWKYRFQFFDQDLENQKFNNIGHSFFKIENEKPILASSSFFSVDKRPWGKSFAAVTMNIIPFSDSETLVVFSYPKRHSGKSRKYIAPIILANGENKKQELSYTLLNRAENFFISPDHLEAWSNSKKEAVEAAFSSNILDGKDLERDPRLWLFN